MLPLEPLLVRPMALSKRGLDLATAIGALLLLSPLLALVALLVKLTSSGPALFHQQRTGVGGKRFNIYKFRSMVTDAEVNKQWLMAFNEQDGPAFKIKNDPARDGRRPVLAENQHRRVAAVMECRAGRHVAGRAASASLQRGECLRPVAASAS